MSAQRPSVLGVALIALLDLLPALRPRMWRWWYDTLARRDERGELMLMNFGYADGEAQPPMTEAEEPYRYPLQLYHRLAVSATLRGQSVLEVGCGRGGGAAFLTRRHRPARYLGLDLSPQAIAWCRQRHHEPGLAFAVGRADILPAEDASIDVVLNVESSHCYPSMPAFLRQVARVLGPDGRFVFCDLRTAKGWATTRRQFGDAGPHVVEEECINDQVLRALDTVAGERTARIAARVPTLWQRLFRDFTGVRDGALYTMLRHGRLRYMRVLARRMPPASGPVPSPADSG